MKVGDLLIKKGAKSGPTILVLEIKTDSSSRDRDEILLQWVPTLTGQPMKGEFSRRAVEKHYEAV